MQTQSCPDLLASLLLKINPGGIKCYADVVIQCGVRHADNCADNCDLLYRMCELVADRYQTDADIATQTVIQTVGFMVQTYRPSEY